MPKAVPHRSKPCGDGMAADELGQDGELAAGDLDARGLRADLQPEGDARERLGVGLLDGQVVEHRDRLGADADEVVDVHGDAVDAHRLQAIGLLGDDDLRAHAVGRHRDAEVRRHAQHRGVVAAGQDRRAGPVELDGAQDADEGVDGAIGLAGVDAGGGVGLAHRDRFCQARRSTSRRERARGRRRRARTSGRARPRG